ncbi:MAG: galactokinase [Oscillospiraceae bacterium]|nr:galactokinase [Oscillospiraceae bacterium]MCL2280201.1 galactokinase [Oscillospiraceae bacterium]
MNERIFSAPGRVEIGGNHTDHQYGFVLAAAVDLEITCTAVPNGTSTVNLYNKQYGDLTVDLSTLERQEDEKESTAALVRGVAAWFDTHGHAIGGFDATVSSTIPAGSGLSSSAAFEVLLGNIFKGLFGAEVSPLDIAIAGKYAENEYFGKPCGLMDQAASSFGGLSKIDFTDPENTIVTPVPADFSGYSLCVVDTGGSHADLTNEYAAIPSEMKTVAGHFGKSYLSEVSSDVFYEQIDKLRHLSSRAILRSIHFYDDDARVRKQAAALNRGDMQTFLDLVNESGRSSLAYLQNVFTGAAPHDQGLTLALALSEKILKEKGAWRVHGGGFAGTILAFVPDELREQYSSKMCAFFGDGACHFLNVRKEGGIERSCQHNG